MLGTIGGLALATFVFIVMPALVHDWIVRLVDWRNRPPPRRPEGWD